MISHAVLADLAHAIVCFLGRTTTFRSENEERWRRWILEQRGQAIFAFWHNQILLAAYYLIGRWIRGGAEGSAMISASRDGGYLAALIRRFGVAPVRGSTTRGGVAALRGMLANARSGHLLAITPDGPLGPVYRVQPGVIQIARLTGIPICPVASASSRFLTFSTWDEFTLPLPFARAEVVFGEPLNVGPDDDVEEKRLELEEAMTRATNTVFRRVGRPVPRAEPDDSPRGTMDRPLLHKPRD